jgi:hypothetical protein
VGWLVLLVLSQLPQQQLGKVCLVQLLLLQLGTWTQQLSQQQQQQQDQAAAQQQLLAAAPSSWQQCSLQ